MNSLAKNFTKGGQVSLHNLRMIRQVLWVTLLLTFLGTVIFWIGKTFYDYTPYERYVIQSVYWAKLKTIFITQQVTQLYHYENGTAHVVLSRDLINNPVLHLWIKDFEHRLLQNAFVSLWVGGGLFLFFCTFWIWRGRSKAQKEILAGTEVVSSKELRRLIHHRGEASDLTLAGVPLLKDKEKQHLLVIGTTGSGKTNCIHELLMQIRAKSQRVIIIDMTGVYIDRYYRPGYDKILNPLDERSEIWSLWHDCPEPHHLRTAAVTLIASDQRGQESFWVRSSRSVFTTTALKLRELGKLTTQSFFEKSTHHPIKQVEGFYQDTSVTAIMNSDAQETVMGIRATLRAHTECLDFIPDLEEGVIPFSLREWIGGSCDGEDDSWLFLSSPPEQREELAPLISLWTTLATDALMGLSPDPNRRLWLIIDELPALKKLPKLHTLLAEARKYGGCIILGTQDMSQLDDVYGSNMVKSIGNLCSTKVIFRMEGAEVAERLSKWLGTQEVSETLEHISYGAHQMRDGVSLNDHRREKATIHPDRLMKLPNLVAYLKLPGEYPIARVEFEYWG